MSTLFALLLAQATPAPGVPAPATPAAAVDPARAAAAERVVAALIPPGTYMRIMRDQFPKLMDGMLGGLFGMGPKDVGAPADLADGKTLGDVARAEDPHFDERMKIMTRVFAEEFGTVYDAVEPDLRAGLARAFAKKFTLQQLTDLDAFFATPSGKAFANDYLGTFMDPEVMQSMMGAMPKMIEAMPDIMAKVEKATAHLPPPPKKSAEPASGKTRS